MLRAKIEQKVCVVQDVLADEDVARRLEVYRSYVGLPIAELSHAARLEAYADVNPGFFCFVSRSDRSGRGSGSGVRDRRNRWHRGSNPRRIFQNEPRYHHID